MRKSGLWRVTIGTRQDGRVYVNVFVNGVRYRFANGEAIGVNLQPNFETGKKRVEDADLLKSAFELALRKGWQPLSDANEGINPKPKVTVSEPSVYDVLCRQYKIKVESGLSNLYLRDLKRVCSKWKEFAELNALSGLTLKHLTKTVLLDFIFHTTKSPRAQKNFKLNVSALLKNELEESGLPNPFLAIKLRKTQEKLHKPFEDVSRILIEIKGYNFNLYLCCLITYGMLLRPHQEVRKLRWIDFNGDLSILSLSGSRNKSQRNRIVPVPDYIRKVLFTIKVENKVLNIFSGEIKEFSEDYFKGIWTKFKNQSDSIEEGQTIYSFRHSGAIDVFRRTNNLNLLSKLMGHGSLIVTLTYLRGLELITFEAEDLPKL